MKKLTKLITLALCVAMIISAFAGCGGKESAIGGMEKSDLVLNGDKIYPIQSDTVLDYWFITGLAPDVENFGDTPLAAEIERLTGVKINYMHAQSGGGKEQFQIMLASDDLPDIVEHDWKTYPGGPAQAITDEYIYDLTDIIPEWAPALTKIFKEHPEWERQSKTEDGKYFAYPFIRGEKKLCVGAGNYIRKDWLDDAGLPVPETIDDWYETLKVFKANGAKRPLTGTQTKNPFVWAYGVTEGFYLDGNTVKYGPYEPGYKEFLTTFSKWYKEGLVDPDIAINDAKTVDAAVMNGDAGVIYGWAGGGLGKYLSAAQNDADVDPDFNMVAVNTPVLKKGEKPEFGQLSNDVVLTYSAAISKNCKDVELAARFLDFGYTEQGNITYNFGVEGESFNWVEKDGKQYPQYTDLILRNPEGKTISDMLRTYTRASVAGIMVQRVEYVEQYYQMPQQKEALDVFANTNMEKHLMPSITIPTEKSEEYADKMSQIKTYVDEMYVKFLTGRESLDKYDEFIAQLEKFGVKDVIAIQQAAYDAYRK